MRSLTSDYLTRLAFTMEDMAAIRRLGESAGRQKLFASQRPDDLEALRTSAIIESSESSNRIEGVVAAPGRVEAIVTRDETPRDRSEQEIAGYRDVLRLIHESHEEMPLTANLLLQLHQRLFAYQGYAGGKWKTVDNDIVERDSSGLTLRVRFKPTPAFMTAEAMREFEQSCRRLRTENVDPLVLTPLAVLDFLCIHPFLDGNGRIGRLLTLLMLYQGGHGVGRYISLERIIEESRETYYEALERSSGGWHDGKHDALPWLRYFWGVMTRAYGQFEERAGTWGGRGSKRERIRAAVERRLLPFGIADIEADCPGCSREMVRLVLREMRDEGVLRAESSGRGARWVKVEAGR